MRASAIDTLERDLVALKTMDFADLRTMWAERLGTPLPRVRAPLLRLALAYALQERVYGGLSRITQLKLEQLAAGKTVTTLLKPGMRLVREWGGSVHVVTIDDARSIRFNGRAYSSLSEVAKHITGAHRSGPAFFGLKQKTAA